MADVDLHALAALPGFGKAKVELQKAGHWDEFGALDAEKRQWVVELSGNVRATATVKVEARSEEEAEKLALAKAEAGKADWEVDDDPIDFDVDEVRHG